jgi:hypothetical protein
MATTTTTKRSVIFSRDTTESTIVEVEVPTGSSDEDVFEAARTKLHKDSWNYHWEPCDRCSDEWDDFEIEEEEV